MCPWLPRPLLQRMKSARQDERPEAVSQARQMGRTCQLARAVSETHHYSWRRLAEDPPWRPGAAITSCAWPELRAGSGGDGHCLNARPGSSFGLGPPHHWSAAAIKELVAKEACKSGDRMGLMGGVALPPTDYPRMACTGRRRPRH